jgi:hypothetical protein
MMGNIKLKIYAWILLGLAFGTWFLLIFINEGSFTFTIEAIKLLPKVITINVFIWAVFIKWIWKWRIFKGWLVPFPNLSGKWEGSAVPKNINPDTGQQYSEIKLELIIKQTFLMTHIRVYSEEMESNSYSASFKIDSDTDEKRICYSYLSKPKSNIRDRSPIHDGTALLTIKGEKDELLEGEYWTNRASTGELYFERAKK